MNDEKIKISYCTTCHNRLWQLALTIKSNLLNLKNNEELILVNYGSKDGLNRYIENNDLCRKFISERKLRYIEVLDVDKYDCSRAKNIAHRFANGNMLVNLDADNFNTKIRKTILGIRNYKKTLIHLWANSSYNGTYGKICISKKNFFKLGGYDESFLPIAYQDTDFIQRAIKLNIPYILKPISAKIIENDIKEKSENTGFSDWWECFNKNKEMSNSNLANKNFVANKDKGWGYAKIIMNFKYIREFKKIFPE